ncbi:MAG: pyridoxal 5'-phosphate synthase glutaminase subunit PdxT [Pseudonocardiales bacterium]
MTHAAPVVGVLALQGDVREHVFALTDAGARVVPVRRPDELDGVDGLVLPGGESTTMSKLAAAFDLLEPLRKAISAGLPAYGACAGMIMLADRLTGAPVDQETLGGIDMTVRRNAFGRQVDSFEEDLDVPTLGAEPLRAVFIRAPWVEEVGAGVEVLATAQAPSHAGKIVAVRQDHLLATSFHPELTGDTRLHKMFVGMVRERS